jgi:hypothetical protein
VSGSVAKKLGVRPGARAFFVHPPARFSNEVGLPPIDLKSRLTGKFEYIHFFVVTQKEFHGRFDSLRKHLGTNGTLWVSWPKAKQKQTDLTLTKVIEIGYDYGLVESKSISINSMWSALKFTHPKEGKMYNNSYGTLKRRKAG